MADQPTSVDQYIDGFSPEVRSRLIRVRELLLQVMPDAEQTIRYGMPALMLSGRYGLHFAGWKKHIGLYPVPVFDGELEAAIQPLRSGKDSVTLAHAKPLPEHLITRIAQEVVGRRAG